MSATGRNHGERQADDFYATPYWVTRAILPKLRPNAVLDPFAGEGAILDVVQSTWGSRTLGIELDLGRQVIANKKHTVWHGDSLQDKWDLTPFQYIPSVVTNPAYCIAMEAILRALKYASTIDVHERAELAFLLRINFLGAQKRAEFHKKHPADVYVLPRRPNFVLAIACKPPKGCGWADVIPYNPDGTLCRPRPEKCPSCNGSLSASSSDATEYAWFVWGPGRGGRWEILDVEHA